MANAPKMQNIHGSANSYLKSASKRNTSSSLVNQAVKSAPKDQQQLVQNILAAIQAQLADSDVYQLTLDSKSTDVILGRIATLLDSYKLENLNENLETLNNSLEGAKEEVLDAVSGLSIDNIVKTLLATGIAQLFDDDAKKEDIEDLKQYLTDLFQQNNQQKENAQQVTQEEQIPTNNVPQNSNNETSNEVPNEEQNTEDEKVGEYQDSTIAQNFAKLQGIISAQIALLNENLKNIPGQGGLGAGLSKMISSGFNKVTSLISAVGEKISKVSSSVAGVTKNLAGNAIGGIMNLVKGISGSVAGIGLGVLGAVAAVKGLGAGLKGIGNSIGNMIASPFKKIGSFFKARKQKNAEKAQAKKESLREKFMNMMMAMMERLWDFLEPILTKLKIFMLATLIPILLTAIKVLAILAIVTLLIVGIVLAVLWIKNKLIPKIKKLWKAAIAKIKIWWGKFKDWLIKKWESFKNWIINAWQVIKDVCKAIWDGIIYIVTFKWLVDFGKWIWKQLVSFGKWIWEKLLEFGQYIYDKFLAPILDPIFKFYYKKIEPKIRPFIDSIKNLVDRIKQVWQKFKWDENKSFFENLKCLASIVKDAILDWWNTSPFKTFYENYLDPIIKSVQDLIGRIKNVWQSFNWDESKSFIDNLMVFWENIKTAIIDWWNGSVIKTYYDKLVEFLSNMMKPIIDWYEQSELKKWIDKIVVNIADIGSKVKNWLIEKLSGFSIPIPNGIEITWKEVDPGQFVPNFSIPIPTLKWKDWKPFGGLAPKVDTEINATAPDLGVSKQQNDQSENLAQPQQQQNEQARNLAQQQVQGAMQPVNSINNMNQDTNLELQKTGSEMSQKAAEAQAAADDFRQQQSMIGSQSLSRFDDLEKKLDKYGNDPAVVPLPVPYGPQRNAAMMEDN